MSEDVVVDQNGLKGAVGRKYMRTLIRKALIRDPNLSSYDLVKVLKCNRKTVLKRMKEVKLENIKRMEKDIERLRTTTVEQELGKIETELSEVVRDLWAVASAKNVTYKERVNALRAIITARKDLFGLKFDAGLFIRSLGKVDVNVAELVKRIKEENNGDGRNNSESSL